MSELTVLFVFLYLFISPHIAYCGNIELLLTDISVYGPYFLAIFFSKRLSIVWKHLSILLISFWLTAYYVDAVNAAYFSSSFFIDYYRFKALLICLFMPSSSSSAWLFTSCVFLRT